MMTNYENYRHFLQQELLKRVKANPSYSQRAFARSLNLSPGSLSEILSGKRKLTHKAAIKIAKRLGLSHYDTDSLLTLVQNEILGIEPTSLPRIENQNLTLEIFEVISNWYYFAILSLCECKNFSWSEKWIAAKLGIQEIEVKIAIENLLKVGLIEKDERGNLIVLNDYVISPDGVPSQAIKNFHEQILSKAKKALYEQNIEEREISGITIAIDTDEIKNIKKDIHKFLDHIVEKYSKGNKNAVYQLETAFFRLTTGDTENENVK